MKNLIDHLFLSLLQPGFCLKAKRLTYVSNYSQGVEDARDPPLHGGLSVLVITQ
jgi:hypothetical protein